MKEILTSSQNNRALRSNPNAYQEHTENDIYVYSKMSQNNRALRSNPN